MSEFYSSRAQSLRISTDEASCDIARVILAGLALHCSATSTAMSRHATLPTCVPRSLRVLCSSWTFLARVRRFRDHREGCCRPSLNTVQAEYPSCSWAHNRATLIIISPVRVDLVVLHGRMTRLSRLSQHCVTPDLANTLAQALRTLLYCVRPRYTYIEPHRAILINSRAPSGSHAPLQALSMVQRPWTLLWLAWLCDGRVEALVTGIRIISMINDRFLGTLVCVLPSYQRTKGERLQVFTKGPLVNVGIAFIVAFAALSVVLSSLVAESHRHNSPNRFKFDVQFQASNFSQGPGASEATQRRLGNLEQSLSKLTKSTAVPEFEPVLTDLHAYPSFNSSAPKRVALLVFGLQRSLFLTFPSVVDHMIRPLTDVGYEVTIFVHQYDDVGHSDEHSGGVKGDWWSMLRPFKHSVTSQKEFLASSRCGHCVVACSLHQGGQ